jgi:hypothetical protein
MVLWFHAEIAYCMKLNIVKLFKKQKLMSFKQVTNYKIKT